MCHCTNFQALAFEHWHNLLAGEISEQLSTLVLHQQFNIPTNIQHNVSLKGRE